MPEEITDSEREELGRIEKETRSSKKEPTIEELLKCPTWDCDGGPEVWSTGTRTPSGAIWCVGCPKCRGWISQMLIPDGVDPYEKGIDVWMEMRKNLGK